MVSLSHNALHVLRSRYLLRDSGGNITETPEQLFRRVAYAVASVEKAGDIAYWEETFYNLMSELYFLPNSPTLMNAGTSVNQLSACYVLPIEGDLNQLFNTLKNACLIHESNGGTGFNFSALPPRKETDGNPLLGPLTAIGIFNGVMEELKHMSKRAGANMGILNVWHPDIEAFIQAKKKEGRLRNFNLSVGITDAFMQAVDANINWTLRYPHTGEPVEHVKARDLWDQLIMSAWQSGDPGLIFLDELERRNTVPGYGKLECTNPCGEVPLFPYEACNLGSINLARFVKEKEKKKYIDWDLLRITVTQSTRFLDNVITAGHYPIPEIEEIVYNNRKIGLGIMGWAEMLIMLEMSYQSPEAILLARQVMHFISNHAYRASSALANERGVFPHWEKSIYHQGRPLRNATCTSIAPTGSISIIANTTPSIEPLFALAFTRKHILGDESLSELNSALLKYLDQHKITSKELMQEIMVTGKFPLTSSIPEHIRKIFLTANEIDIETHLQHQAAFQLYTDNAVSKTINLPNGASPEMVAYTYRRAWKLGLKGITVFRQGSRQQEVLHTGISPACRGNNQDCIG